MNAMFPLPPVRPGPQDQEDKLNEAGRGTRWSRLASGVWPVRPGPQDQEDKR